MLYITGDVHGDYARLSEEKLKFMKANDTLIICGDFGFVWDDSRSEDKNLRALGKRKYNICFLDGVHENHALINRYPVRTWCGGKTHHISGNLRHLMRGEVFRIGDQTVFAMGGGERRESELALLGESESSPEAAPSKDEMLQAVANLERQSYQVDVIVTHEPPSSTRDYLMMRSDESMSVNALDAYLNELTTLCKYHKWFFGSMHLDKYISNNQVAVYRKFLSAKPGLPV